MTKETKQILKRIINAFKKETELQCYSVDLIESESLPDIFDNKIGGIPYLPLGEAYPLDKHGNPMALLLQLNCKDIDLPNFPKTGYLEIYMNANLSADTECTVKHFDTKPHQTIFPKIDLSNFIVQRPYAIKLQKTTCHMPVADYRFDKTFTDISTRYGRPIQDIFELDKIFPNESNIDEEFITLLDKELKNPRITIGGYADFTQDDPRFYDEPKDLCILKVDSCYQKGRLIDIGDAGILNVYTHANDFKNKNFDSVQLVWDCY